MEPFCVKFYEFYQGMRDTDTDTDVSFGWNRKIFKNQQKSTYPVLVGTLQMQWQRHLTPVLSNGTDCFKYYHTEIKYWS